MDHKELYQNHRLLIWTLEICMETLLNSKSVDISGHHTLINMERVDLFMKIQTKPSMRVSGTTDNQMVATTLGSHPRIKPFLIFQVEEKFVYLVGLQD